MNKALSIVGYKKSGKTRLMLELIQELKQRGLEVSSAKFSHHSLDKENTDSAKIGAASKDMTALNDHETMFLWNEKKYLPDLLPLMQGDVLLAEGGKSLGWLPRVIILKDPSELEELNNGLALATWGKIKTDHLPHLDNIRELADLVISKGFLLPGLDCGSCGHETCRELARKIVSEKATPASCLAKRSNLEITINGQPLGMNPFVERVICKSIQGMLSELKGYSPGRVEIKIG
ncbi:MAG: molybdopterin-guanine dinucleotide biosynthesis protein MobB [Desulfonatronovibrio sp.]